MEMKELKNKCDT